MATVTKGKTFGATETVTNTKLHALVDDATVTGIVNADVGAGAAIAESKLDLSGSGYVTTGGNNAFTGDNTHAGTETFSAATVFDLPPGLPAASVDAITEIKSTLKSGADVTLITGTKGTTNYVPKWNGDGDLVDGHEVLDEDAMGSDSATKLATQQSIKKYVDDNSNNRTLYTSNDTFTVPAGITTVYVTMVAGGGGGATGGSDGTGGGGSGAFCVKSPHTVTPSAELTVTVGGGGATNVDGTNTVFDTLTVEKGLTGTGSVGGVGGSVGDFSKFGQPGRTGELGIAGAGGDGAGGNFGVGGLGGAPGQVGTGYGVGGGAGNNTYAGAAGKAGFVLVEW